MPKTIIPATLLALACTGFIAAASANDGTYDPGFGNYMTGRSVVNLAEDPMISVDQASAFALLPDGGLVIAGRAIHGLVEPTKMAALQLDASGQPDPAFGTGGIALVQPPGDPAALWAHAILRQADGKLLLVGIGSYANDNGVTACRLHADGTPDFGYGEEGCARHAPGGDGYQFRHGPVAATVDAAGRLLVAATASPDSAFTVNMAVVRLLPDGTLDGTFGKGGLVAIERFDEMASSTTAEQASAIVLDAVGRIVLAGGTRPRDSNGFGQYAMALARLDANGVLDPQFGDGGAQRVDFGLDTIANAVALTADGAIVACGTTTIRDSSPIDTDFAVARVDAQGMPDPGFAEDGRLILPFHGETSREDVCAGVVVQADGRIVLAGHALNAASAQYDLDLAMARVWPDGRLDRGFGNQHDGHYIGALNLGIDDSHHSEQLVAIAMQGERLVAAGFAKTGYDQYEFVAVRLLADGVFADSFD